MFLSKMQRLFLSCFLLTIGLLLLTFSFAPTSYAGTTLRIDKASGFRQDVNPETPTLRNFGLNDKLPETSEDIAWRSYHRYNHPVVVGKIGSGDVDAPVSALVEWDDDNKLYRQPRSGPREYVADVYSPSVPPNVLLEGERWRLVFETDLAPLTEFDKSYTYTSGMSKSDTKEFSTSLSTSVSASIGIEGLGGESVTLSTELTNTFGHTVEVSEESQETHTFTFNGAARNDVEVKAAVYALETVYAFAHDDGSSLVTHTGQTIIATSFPLPAFRWMYSQVPPTTSSRTVQFRTLTACYKGGEAVNCFANDIFIRTEC